LAIGQGGMEGSERGTKRRMGGIWEGRSVALPDFGGPGVILTKVFLTSLSKSAQFSAYFQSYSRYPIA
jgi:hypothetical protein